jgi:hypothetical protein
MTWALVQQVGSGEVNSATVTTLSVTFGSTPTQNNLIFFTALTYSDAWSVSGSGWTVYETEGGGNPTIHIGWKIAGAAESSTVTITGTTARVTLHAFEYSGVDTANPVDVTNVPYGTWGMINSSTVLGGNTPQPDYAGGLYVSLMGMRDGDSTTTYRLVTGAWTNAQVPAATATYNDAHRVGTDGAKLYARTYVCDTYTSDQPCYVSMSGDIGGGFWGSGAMSVVFRASGAAAARPLISGSPSVTLVTTGAATVSGAGTALTVGTITGQAENDIIVVGLAPAGTSITPPTGDWAELPAAGGGLMRVFWRTVGSSPPSSYAFTFAPSSSTRAAVYHVWRPGAGVTAVTSAQSSTGAATASGTANAGSAPGSDRVAVPVLQGSGIAMAHWYHLRIVAGSADPTDGTMEEGWTESTKSTNLAEGVITAYRLFDAGDTMGTRWVSVIPGVGHGFTVGAPILSAFGIELTNYGGASFLPLDLQLAKAGYSELPHQLHTRML